MDDDLDDAYLEVGDNDPRFRHEHGQTIFNSHESGACGGAAAGDAPMTLSSAPSGALGDPFDDFDPLARWIMVVATSEARLARHPVVSGAHIVLANWLAVGTPLGDGLRREGFSGRIAKAWLEHEVRPAHRSDDPRPDERLVVRARSISADNGDGTVGAVHLFIAATAEAESDGVRMIRAQGISVDRIQHVVTLELEAPTPTSVWERLDETARAVVVSAGEYAADLAHAEIGIGHLLLGLVDTPSAAQVVLHDARVTPGATRLAFRAIVGRGEPADAPGHPPFGRDAAEVLLDTGAAGRGAVSAMDLLGVLIARDHGDHIEVMHTLGTDLEGLRSGMHGEPAYDSAGHSGPPTTARAVSTRRGGPEILLIALACLGVLAGRPEALLVRVGLGIAALAALAIGVVGLVRAASYRGASRSTRVVVVIALGLAAAGYLVRASLG